MKKIEDLKESFVLSFFVFFIYLSLTVARVTLISPENNIWTNGTNDTIAFVFKHTLGGDVNCTLFVNDTSRGTKTVQAGENTFYSNSTILEGKQNWYVKCENSTASETSEKHNLNVDRTKPQIDLLSPVFKFNATDNLANILLCRILIDGRIVGEREVEIGENYIDVDLDEGRYTWKVECIDKAGNVNTSISKVVEVDKTSQAIILKSPQDNSYINSREIIFEFDIDVEVNFNEGAECSLYINNILNQTSPLRDDKKFVVHGFDEGTYIWEIRCRDSASIRYSKKNKITVDITPPSVQLNSPASGTIIDDSTPTFYFYASDNLSPTLNCSLIITSSFENLEKSIVFDKGYTSITSDKLVDGDKNWKIKCKDLAGNENTSVTWTIRIIPKVDIVSPPPGTIHTGISTVNIKVISDQLLSEAKLEWNGVNTSLTCSQYSCEGQRSGLSEGVTNKYKVWAKGQRSGYWGVSAEREITYLVTLAPTRPERAFAITLAELPIITWSMIVIIIVTVVLAIGFMISKIFMVPEWEAWIRNEFGQVMFSILLIVLFAAFGTVYDFIASDMAKGILQHKNMIFSYDTNTGRWSWSEGQIVNCPSPCHIYIARGFLGFAYERGGKTYKDLVVLYTKSYLIESIGVGGGFAVVFPTVFGLSMDFPLYAARAIYNNALKTAAMNLGKLLPYLKLQEMFLYYVPAIVTPLFGLGVILRIPFFTRKLGGLLIAISFGIYFIFPLIYILEWYTIDISQVEVKEPLRTPSDIKSLFTTVPSIEPLFEDGSVYDAIGKFYIPAYFLPIFALLVTLGFIKHFSPMVGGDTEIAGLSRLI